MAGVHSFLPLANSCITPILSSAPELVIRNEAKNLLLLLDALSPFANYPLRANTSFNNRQSPINN
jgi:hypothetical protein